MKYNVNYNLAQAMLTSYVSAKKNVNAMYRIQKPACTQDEYAEYVAEHGIPDNIPKSRTITENFVICKNAEAILKFVLSSDPDKAKLWSFIFNEEYFKKNTTVQKKIIALENMGINISRATYYRESAAFVNAFAEAAGLGNKYTNKKNNVISMQDINEGRSMLL